MYIEHHPEISKTNFNEMRAHYKDYLRSKNFNNAAINSALFTFDINLNKQNFETIYNLMTSIGVILI